MTKYTSTELVCEFLGISKNISKVTLNQVYMSPHEEKQFWKGHSIVAGQTGISLPPLTAAQGVPVDITSLSLGQAPNVRFSDSLPGLANPSAAVPTHVGSGPVSGTTVFLPPIESDPSGGSLNEPGKKADAGKNLPWLFQRGFAHALHEVSRVTTLGARKYTPGGWETLPDGINRYMEAFSRHTSELAMGNTYDDGPTGLGPDIYHKAEMIWNLLASLELEIRESKK